MLFEGHSTVVGVTLQRVLLPSVLVCTARSRISRGSARSRDPAAAPLARAAVGSTHSRRRIAWRGASPSQSATFHRASAAATVCAGTRLRTSVLFRLMVASSLLPAHAATSKDAPMPRSSFFALALTVATCFAMRPMSLMLTDDVRQLNAISAIFKGILRNTTSQRVDVFVLYKKPMPTPSQPLKMADLEHISGVHRSTIHHYLNLRLLPRPRVEGPKKHLFGADYVARLKQIQGLRARGWTLPRIREHLGPPASRMAPKPTTNPELKGTRKQIVAHATVPLR